MKSNKPSKETPNSEASGQLADFKTLNPEGNIYKQVFEHSVIPIIVHDMEMNILDFNESALKEFGYSSKELLNKSIFDLHTDEELEHSNQVLAEIQSENKLSVETKFKRKDGSVFTAEATPCKYILEGKPLIHVYIQDITERKLTALILKESNNALRNEMKMTKKFSKEIERKNKELKEFSFVAAHDLKAPVTNISLLSEMIDLSKVDDPFLHELFDKLKTDIDLLNKTVLSLNEVINFKATLNANPVTLSFEETFNEIQKSIGEQIKQADATINTDFSKAPQIKYPALHLKSILQNLLTNALKFRDPEKPLLVEVESNIDNNEIVLIVKDNGLGFDASKQNEKIFGLFKRLHPQVEGMGIGMYIIKSILDSHGDKIEVKSSPGRGTIFKILFKKD